MSTLPVIGITMGDPAGIGGEVIIKSLNQKSITSQCRPIIIGDAAYLKFLTQKFSLPLKITVIDKIKDRSSLPSGAIPVVDLENLKTQKIKFGICNADYGKASYEYILEGIKLASAGIVDALVTAPINKESFFKAGIPYAGHTEVLAHMTKTKKIAMMLVGKKLRVVLATRHIPLKNVARELTKEKILTAIELAYNTGKYFNIPNPRIGVCGLNPHSGEGGTMGDEEIEIIIPAIKKSKEAGINVSGLYASDTIFHKAIKRQYDFIIAMYHDQGLIPLKTLYFDEGVNVTLGLPFVRTSPDHGTAYDIAGKGIASSKSMQEAIKLAVKMSRIQVRNKKIR